MRWQFGVVFQKKKETPDVLTLGVPFYLGNAVSVQFLRPVALPRALLLAAAAPLRAEIMSVIKFTPALLLRRVGT